MGKKRKETGPLAWPPRPPELPVHQVSRQEWDNTMRAALAGIVASGDANLSYQQAVAHARVYAETAHGGRP